MNIAQLRDKHPNQLAKILSLSLMGLVLAGSVLNYMFPRMRYVMWIAGVGLVVSYMLFILKNRNKKLAREIFFYCLFVAWAIVSGSIVANDLGKFANYAQVIFSIMVFAICVSGFVAHYGYFSSVTVIFIILALIMDIYAIQKGGFNLILDPAAQYRAAGFLKNANTLGFFNLLAVYVIIFHLGRTTKNGARILQYGLFAFFSVSIVASGSQKAFYGLISLIIAWLWFCYRKELIKRPLLIVSLGMGIALLYFFINFVLSQTYLGVRYQDTIQGRDGSSLVRLQHYREGWKMFTEHPVAGVGLAQYGVVYSDLYIGSLYTYSHADIMELLATTGIIGFCLYYMSYLILYIRLNRLQSKMFDSRLTYEIGTIKAFLLMLIIISFAKINFFNLETWFFLSGIIGHTYWIEKNSGSLN